jgi:hypothetical protein
MNANNVQEMQTDIKILIINHVYAPLIIMIQGKKIQYVKVATTIAKIVQNLILTAHHVILVQIENIFQVISLVLANLGTLN